MHEAGFKLAIETNGTIATPLRDHDNCPFVSLDCYALDWITVSPKKSPLPLKQLHAHEVKYVIAKGDVVPECPIQTENILISPAFNGWELDKASVDWCIGLVASDPNKWRLSLQQHKWIHAR